MNTPVKISPNFYFHEFFPEEMWRTYSAKYLRRVIDNRVVDIAELLRTKTGRSVFVNNWFWGGNKQYRGFRPVGTPWWSKGSQHSFGRAFDCNVKGMTPDEVRQFMLDNENEFMEAGLTRLEHGDDAPTWVHLDIGWTKLDHIYVFNK